MRSPTDMSKAEKMAGCGLLTALALIFSYVEFLIPLPMAIPGIKPGFANIVVLVCLFSLGAGYALFVNTARIGLAALLFGSIFSGLYALAGGLASLLLMIALKRTGIFSAAGISMAAGAVHNMAQLAVAGILVESALVLYYLPVLLISGAAAGAVTGVIATLILRALGHRI